MFFFCVFLYVIFLRFALPLIAPLVVVVVRRMCRVVVRCCYPSSSSVVFVVVVRWRHSSSSSDVAVVVRCRRRRRLLGQEIPPVSRRLRSRYHVLLVRQHEPSQVENIFDKTRFHVDVDCWVGVQTTSTHAHTQTQHHKYTITTLVFFCLTGLLVKNCSRLMPGFHHSVAVLPLPFRRSAVVKFRCSVKIT